jgi:hypothetical protein
MDPTRIEPEPQPLRLEVEADTCATDAQENNLASASQAFTVQSCPPHLDGAATGHRD